MPPARTRIIRRTSLIARIQAYLNPWDFLLWVSEELNSNELEDSLKQWATPVGVVSNIVFMIARSNTGHGRGGRADSVFADYAERRGSGWLAWFANFVVHFLTLISTINAIYTFTRKRHYRLFEASIDVRPNTPSARRVRVNSSPLSSSPLRYLSSMLAATSAESRAHPDSSKDVWELAVWDPTPFCLRLFTMFSPGHVLVYWFFLPLAPLDPRPSITVVTTIFLATLLSAQLTLLHRFFSQQSKDAALIHKEVQNEYDTKFFNPTLNRPVRDVGTQILSDETPASLAEVNTYTPTTYVNRGFRVNPNPNYAGQYDPSGSFATPTRTQHISRSAPAPSWRSPDAPTPFGNSLRTRDSSLRQSSYLRTNPSAVVSPGGGDGGHLGIYSQAHSPLKRPANPTPGTVTGRHSTSGHDGLRDRGTFFREGSPLKRSSTPGDVGAQTHANGSLGRQDRPSIMRGDGGRR